MTLLGDPDRIGGDVGNQRPTPGADNGVAGKERLTAMAGTLLLVLLVLEIATGVLLAGPLAVKLASTGYRFVRYYTRSGAYVRRGAPRLPLRLLAPPLVATTIVLVGSRIGLVLTGPADPAPLLALHNVTFLVWLPMIAVHAVAYAVRALHLVVADTTEDDAPSPVLGGCA